MPTPISKRSMLIVDIEATAATQIRLRKDPGVIKDYTEALQEGAIFPPVDVYCEENSERYILADGFHRLHAFVDAGRTEIPVNIYRGGMHEALIHALGANHNHGLRLTNADKRHAIQVALKDPVLSKLSSRELADICRVSHTSINTERNAQQLAEERQGSKHNQAGERPAPPSENDRKVKREASQEEVETREFLEAASTIKSFPYQGHAALERMLVDPDLVADAEYVSTWCADLVLAYRKAVKDPH